MERDSGRALAYKIVHTLVNAGHLAYWVGGCVRDELLGLIPKDYDVATSAPPHVVLKLFPEGQPVGASFGVVLVPPDVEVATFRSDQNYADGRRPLKVEYEVDPARDAERRDFTINAIYYDPFRKEVLDFTGGQKDLWEGVIRAIGDARLRFSEDHLRLLRAIRFASRFRYSIEPVTFSAMQEMAPMIRRVAAERLHDEMRFILTGGNLDLAWHYLSTSGLWKELVPESSQGARLSRLKGTVGAPLGWAALLEGVSDPRVVYRRFRFSRAEEDQCQNLLECESRFEKAPDLGLADLKRFVRQSNILDHLKLHEATRGETVQLRFVQELLGKWTHDQLWPKPLITGDDLIRLGHKPGPKFHEILTRVEAAQLEETITTREEALSLAVS